MRYFNSTHNSVILDFFFSLMNLKRSSHSVGTTTPPPRRTPCSGTYSLSHLLMSLPGLWHKTSFGNSADSRFPLGCWLCGPCPHPPRTTGTTAMRRTPRGHPTPAHLWVSPPNQRPRGHPSHLWPWGSHAHIRYRTLRTSRGSASRCTPSSKMHLPELSLTIPLLSGSGKLVLVQYWP